MPTSLTTNYNLPIFDLYSNPAFLMFFIGPIILLLGLVCVNLNILKQYPYLIVLLGMIIITLLSFNVWGNFIPLLESIQIGFVINFFPVLLNGVSLGLDGLSLLLVILTNFFILLGILSLTQQTVHLNEALGNLLVLQIGVCLAFVAMDLIGFFTFFEITLIPIYFLILG
jgi:NADH-quinone oxidoreductase subunit M